MFTKFFSTIAALVFGFAISCASNASVILNIDNQGILTGATGVVVDQKSYSVRFMDGTCASLFDGCDSNSDFLFNTLDSANLASQALFNQVFLGFFDVNPQNTTGCHDLIGCITFTPYLFRSSYNDIYATAFTNFGADRDRDDMVQSPVGFGTSADLTDWRGHTWAVWTADEIATVPEPSSLTLFALSAVALIWSRRRRIGARAQ